MASAAPGPEPTDAADRSRATPFGLFVVWCLLTLGLWSGAGAAFAEHTWFFGRAAEAVGTVVSVRETVDRERKVTRHWLVEYVDSEGKRQESESTSRSLRLGQHLPVWFAPDHPGSVRFERVPYLAALLAALAVGFTGVSARVAWTSRAAWRQDDP